MPDRRLYQRHEDASVLWGGPETGLRWREHSPPGLLRTSVERVLVGREEVGSGVEEDILPDGRLYVVFVLGSRPAAVVVGATAAPRRLRLEGTVETVTVLLRPGGVRALLGAPAAELGGREVPLDGLWGAEAGQLLSELGEASLEERGTRLIARLAARGPRASVDVRAARAVAWLQRAPKVGARQLADKLGMGPRRLQQLFLEEIGLPARQLRRILRFRRATALLHATPVATGAEVAVRAGYFDEAHLVREVRALAGVTPGALRDFASVQLAGTRQG